MDLDKEELEVTKKKKEKTADEMFLELGYERQIETPDYFLYQDEENNKEILFYKYDKDIEIGLIDAEEYNYSCAILTMQELKAINKFYEERGWNEC